MEEATFIPGDRRDYCSFVFLSPPALKCGRADRAGQGWANFLVMRRTHATIMKQLGVDPKTTSDQLGHSVDVDINVYTRTPLEFRQSAVEQLESALVM